MIEQLSGAFHIIGLHGLILGIVLFVGTLLLSLAVVSIVLVKIPPDYFNESHPRDLWTGRNPGIRLVGIVGKNILGALLVALGIVLSIPGVPGQGILTILLGVMLLDIPGKRRLEHRLVSRPNVLRAINKLRRRFGKPNLVLH